jgi:hypothetical protein
VAKIRVYALAKELEVDSQRVIDLARELGVEISRPSNALDDDLANQIREMQASMTAAAPARKPEPEIEPEPEAEEPANLTEPASEELLASPPERPTAPLRPITPIKPSVQSPVNQRAYLIDGLNVCNWGKQISLAPLLTLLVELKRRQHPFLCIFDANSRFVLEEFGEREHYEHLLSSFDCIGEVPGGTQADDFLLFRAHKTGEAIVTNDQYRDPKYRERYKWLRSVSPRLCKGIVVGGYLMIPELDIHARIRENLGALLKDFDALFRQKHREHRETQNKEERVPTEPLAEPVPEEQPEMAAAPPTAPAEEQTAAGQRPRSRRRRRRGGRRPTP